MNYKKFLSFTLLAAGMLTMVGCQHSSKADLVVYGKIYTAEGNQLAEAFATYFEGKKVYSK